MCPQFMGFREDARVLPGTMGAMQGRARADQRWRRRVRPSGPSCVYSRVHPEQVDDSCELHAIDALRYALGRKKVSCGTRRVRWTL
jgi:hypothetical protein